MYTSTQAITTIDRLKQKGMSPLGDDAPILQTVLPAFMLFPKPQIGANMTKSLIRIPAKSSRYSTDSSNKIIIDLNKDGFIHLKNGYLMCKIALREGGVPDSTYLRMQNGTWSCIKEVLVKVGGTIIERKQNYNQVLSMQFEAFTPGDVSSTIFKTLYGFGSQAERNASYSSVREYLIPLDLESISKSILPTHFLRNQITLELILEDPNSCLESDSTQRCDIDISDVYLHVHKYLPGASYRNSIHSQLQDKGFGMHFLSTEVLQNKIPAGSTSVDLNIPHKVASLGKIITLMVNDSTMADKATNDKMYNWNFNNLNTVQYRINSNVDPQEPHQYSYNNALPGYLEYLMMAGKHALNGKSQIAVPIDGNTFTNNRAVLVWNIPTFDNVDVVNPIGTFHNSSDLQVKLTFNSPIPVDQRVIHIVYYYQVMNISANGITRRILN